MNLGDTDPDVFITSISFDENMVIIQYAERREQSRAAAIARSIMIDAEQVTEEVDELQEVARALVDKGVLLIRNPPKRLRRPTEVEDDEDA